MYLLPCIANSAKQEAKTTTTTITTTSSAGTSTSTSTSTSTRQCMVVVADELAVVGCEVIRVGMYFCHLDQVAEAHRLGRPLHGFGVSSGRLRRVFRVCDVHYLDHKPLRLRVLGFWLPGFVCCSFDFGSPSEFAKVFTMHCLEASGCILCVWRRYSS